MANAAAMQSWCQPLSRPRSRNCSLSSVQRWRPDSSEAYETVVKWISGAQVKDISSQEFDPHSQSISDIRDVVAAIRESRPLIASTSEFDQLLTQAVHARGTPKNIREWADRLAADIGDLTD